MARCDFDHDRDIYRPIWRLLRRVLSVYSMPIPPLPSPDRRKNS